jgi:hypothetical protein
MGGPAHILSVIMRPRMRSRTLGPKLLARMCDPCAIRILAASMGTPRKRRKPPPLQGFPCDGRYWARTSDPQLVELVLSQLS